jgi:hypothetical protein
MKINTYIKKYFSVLLILSLLLVPTFALEDNEIEILDKVVELEYGSEADEDFTSYDLRVKTKTLNESLIYTSSNAGIVFVNQSGQLKARNPGKVTITVENEDKSHSDQIEVTVYLLGDDQVPLGQVGFVKAYVSGYPDGNFKPNDFTTRAEVAVMLYRGLELEASLGSYAFSDVYDDDWYYEAIQTLADKGLILGDNEGNFRPNELITKAELASLLDKYYNKSDVIEVAHDMVFDIAENHWAKLSIYKMLDQNILSYNSPGIFGPEDHLSRGEMVIVINKCINRQAYDGEKIFDDVSDEADYADHIKAASQSYFQTYE